ncbi:MAG TPA: GTP-binding protein, partial [Paenirhodobacter sp.]
FDYLLIEGTGVAEPLPIAATFDFRDEAGQSLSDVSRLDTMVTVVDAINLTRDFASQDFISDRGESVGEDDERTLVDLLTDQIEFADIVVLNKAADADPVRLERARQIVHALNPDARLIETDFGRVQPEDIFDTGRFDFDKAHEHPMWAKELYGFADHVPETEEYGISSFVYRARRPFRPRAVYDVLTGDLPGVIRAKGHFWIASRPNWAAEFSLAGVVSSVTPLGGWWASVPRDRWPTHPDSLAEVARVWQEPWGDRRQELVFIGSGMDKAAITAALDAALVEAWDFTPDAWAALPDPFPQWGQRRVA